jgi:hypothetical protein
MSESTMIDIIKEQKEEEKEQDKRPIIWYSENENETKNSLPVAAPSVEPVESVEPSEEQVDNDYSEEQENSAWIRYKTEIYFLALKYGFLIYFTYACSIVPKELTNTATYWQFLTSIVLTWITSISNWFWIRDLYALYYLGATLTPLEWRIFTRKSQMRWCIWINNINCIIMFPLMLDFFPAGWNQCGPFTESDPNICLALQLMCIWTIIYVLRYVCPIIILCILKGLIFVVRFIIGKRAQNRTRLIMDRLATIYDPSPEAECSICIGSPEPNEQIAWTILKCKHIFHRECIATWFKQNPTCPNCRNIDVVV